MSKNIEKIISHIINEEHKLADDLLGKYILTTTKLISESFDDEDNIVDDRTASIIDDIEEIEAEEYYSDVDLTEEEEDLEGSVEDLENELTAHEIEDLDLNDRVTSLEDKMNDLRNNLADFLDAETVPDYGSDDFDEIDDIEGLTAEFDETRDIEEGRSFRHSDDDDFDREVDALQARIAKKRAHGERQQASSNKRHIDDTVDTLSEETSGDFELEEVDIDLEGDEFVGDSDEKIEIDTDSVVPDVKLDDRPKTQPVEYAPSNDEVFEPEWETGPIYKNMSNTSEDYFSDYFEKVRKDSIMSKEEEDKEFPEPDTKPVFPVTEGRRRKV